MVDKKYSNPLKFRKWNYIWHTFKGTSTPYIDTLAQKTVKAKKEGDGGIINFITLLGLPYIIVNIIIKYITGLPTCAYLTRT